MTLNFAIITVLDNTVMLSSFEKFVK